MSLVLITNDDGYNSAGFFPLVKELSTEFSIAPVVPDRGQSWVAKAITIKKPLHIKKIKHDTLDLFLLNGTPADCVQIGMHHVAKHRPDLVVSGINIGLNIGTARMLSSGTIGAAMEASLEGVKAIASSISIPLSLRHSTDFYSKKSYPLFEQSAKITKKIAQIVLNNSFDSGVDFFSVNIPFDATVDSELEITTPFQTPYGNLFQRNKNRFIHHTPPVEFTHMADQTDLKALSEEKISVTPVSLALVSSTSIHNVERILKKAW